ncbi:MAG: hypothetical protein KJ063_24940 [Anaerolineae bacterium]|nr:hypothetical protein [Anaerolineae bacterium]
MPYRDTPWVYNGQIVHPAAATMQIDTPAWFTWLDTLSCFGYGSRTYQIRLTIRREKRRQQTYWYGYSKINAKLHNIYLGKTEQLTLAGLEQACRLLEERGRQERRKAMNDS